MRIPLNGISLIVNTWRYLPTYLRSAILYVTNSPNESLSQVERLNCYNICSDEYSIESVFNQLDQLAGIISIVNRTSNQLKIQVWFDYYADYSSTKCVRPPVRKWNGNEVRLLKGDCWKDFSGKKMTREREREGNYIKDRFAVKLKWDGDASVACFAFRKTFITYGNGQSYSLF